MIRFTEIEQVLLAGASLALLSAIILVAWLFSRRTALTRRDVWIAGALWLVFCTFEYWMLGPHSALGQGDTYYCEVPWIYYSTHVAPSGGYAHAFSGGTDARAGVEVGAQYLSLERLLFGHLPVWLAIACFNAGAIVIAYAGGYRIGRSAFQLPRGQAIVTGLIASGTHYFNLVNVTGGLGWGTAFLPWGYYFFCLRSGRRFYFTGVLLLALLYSGSTSIIHSLPAFFVALLCASAISPPAHWDRFFAGCILFGATCLLNWADIIYAFMQFGPDAARTNVVEETPGILAHLREHADVLAFPAVGVAAVIFAVRRDRRGLLTVAAFWLCFASGHLLGAFPWSAIGSNLLVAYRWSLASEGAVLLGVIVVAQLLRGTDWSRNRRLPPFSLFYFAALPVIAVAYHKATNLLTYRENFGSSIFTHVPLLASPEWRANEPFRVVTDCGVLPPNVVNSYGLDTYDGSIQAYSRRQNRFYGWAVLRPAQATPHTHVHFLRLPPGNSQWQTIANLDGLRIANVRYVISERPLTDTGLRLVAHQADAPSAVAPPGWLRRLAPRESVHELSISEISGAWPRAFIPAAIAVSPHTTDDELFYRQLLSDASTPAMLVARNDAHLLPTTLPVPGAAKLVDFHVVPGGFDLTLAPGTDSSATSGVVIVNAPFTPMWHAFAAGRPRVILPANGIHMAILFEREDRRIELRYHRPTLLEKFAPAP